MPATYPSAPATGRTGTVAPDLPTFGMASTALTAGRGYLAKFVPGRNMNITIIGFTVTTAAGANDNCDVGLYDAAFSRLVSSGATAGKLNGSTGPKTITVATTALAAGSVYYAAFAVLTPFGGSAASLNFATSGGGNFAEGFGSTAGLLEQSANAAYPLPPTWTHSFQSNSPVLFVRES